MSTRQLLRVGTRGSLLARSQTAWLVGELKKKSPGTGAGLEVETIYISSSGDKIQDRPLYEFGGKGLFTKELELALIDGRIDMAVHSFKDVPVTMPLVDESQLVFAGVPGREDVRDVLVSRMARSLEELPQGAKVGTGSLRRRCQILTMRPDLEVEMIRGNIDTRIRKMQDGEFAAIVLAMAGVKRANLWNEAEMTPLPPEVMLPAAGQGALALQCRKDAGWVREIIARVDDPVQRECVERERELVRVLGGDCHSPIGAYARISGEELVLEGMLGQSDGRPPVKKGKASGGRADWRRIVREVAEAVK